MNDDTKINVVCIYVGKWQLSESIVKETITPRAGLSHKEPCNNGRLSDHRPRPDLVMG